MECKMPCFNPIRRPAVIRSRETQTTSRHAVERDAHSGIVAWEDARVLGDQ
jgi:hypothetical protein